MSKAELLEHLLALQKTYAGVFRYTLTSERIARALRNKREINLLAEEFREPLIEHVGHLPILATTLHSHLSESHKIDLGKTLIMLAIHDIGETVLGDIITFKKTTRNEHEENLMALKILSNDLDPYLVEFNDYKTLEAKFATAVDKIAPLLRELEVPEMITARHKVHNINSKIISDKKRQYFDWDPTMLALFDLIIEKYREFEYSSNNCVIKKSAP